MMLRNAPSNASENALSEFALSPLMRCLKGLKGLFLSSRVVDSRPCRIKYVASLLSIIPMSHDQVVKLNDTRCLLLHSRYREVLR